jgi:hypothetical protein
MQEKELSVEDPAPGCRTEWDGRDVNLMKPGSCLVVLLPVVVVSGDIEEATSCLLEAPKDSVGFRA